MRGRKPKPTHLKLVAGNPGRRPLNPREPLPDSTAMPAPPSWLSPEALAEWQKLAPQLHRIGVLTAIDCTAFAARCQVAADLAQAQAKLAKFGPVMRASDRRDRLVLSPYLRIRDRCFELLLRFDAEFGMTPSSRSRVEVSPAAAAVDPAEKYFR